MDSWSSLEVAKLIASILTPLSVVALGWFINRRLKKLDFRQWSNQKLVEKRLALYDEVAPLLNKLLCFYTWKGYWKDISPHDVIEAKRSLDKTVHIYKYVLSERLVNEYENFKKLLFEEYTGVGRGAMIRSEIQSGLGDRRKYCTYKWDKAWDDYFTNEGDSIKRKAISDQYDGLMKAFKDLIGIQEMETPHGSTYGDKEDSRRNVSPPSASTSARPDESKRQILLDL